MAHLLSPNERIPSSVVIGGRKSLIERVITEYGCPGIFMGDLLHGKVVHVEENES